MGLYAELQGRDAKLIAGGAAQNSARGAQYILPDNSTIYFGCVGKDKEAELLVEANAKYGVKTNYRYDPEQRTGRCGVVITGHHRSMCTDLAAANHYQLSHLKENWAHVEEARVLYVGGYHLTVCVPAIEALATHAAEQNKVFALGLSAPFIPQFFKEPLDKILPYTDYIVGNETEALSYAESHSLDTKDVAAIAVALANLPKTNDKRKRTVIITQGTSPTLVAEQGAQAASDVKSFPIKEVAESEITDTNGAGDAFLGGFLAGVVKGEGLEKSVDLGQWLASLSIRELGPSYPFPKQTYQG